MKLSTDNELVMQVFSIFARDGHKMFSWKYVLVMQNIYEKKANGYV